MENGNVVVKSFYNYKYKFNLNSITFNVIILKLYELDIFKNQTNYDIFYITFRNITIR